MVVSNNAIILNATSNDQSVVVDKNISVKSYFNFNILKYNFRLYKDTDSTFVFKILNTDDYRRIVEYSSGPNDLKLEYRTASDEDNRHMFSMSVGFGAVTIYFPWRNKNLKYINGDDDDDMANRYGFTLFNSNEYRKFPDTVIYYQKNKETGKTESVLRRLWWYKDFLARHILLDDKTWAISNNHNEADEFVYKTPFIYQNYQNIVQQTFADVRVYRITNGPKWLNDKGYTFLNKYSYGLDVEFENEVGKDTGSWKGGVFGISIPLTEAQKRFLFHCDIMISLPKILTKVFKKIMKDGKI